MPPSSFASHFICPFCVLSGVCVVCVVIVLILFVSHHFSHVMKFYGKTSCKKRTNRHTYADKCEINNEKHTVDGGSKTTMPSEPSTWHLKNENRFRIRITYGTVFVHGVGVCVYILSGCCYSC